MKDAPACVIFGTPSYSHSVSTEFFKSSIETEWLITAKGLARGYITHPGDQFIAKVRNKIVTEFLVNYPMATDLFFLDDDLGWPAQKVIDFLGRPEDIVAGIYPKKQDSRDFPVELQADLETGALIERDGLIRANGVPTGFMRIKRHVLETLAKHAGKFRDIAADGTEPEYYEIFRAGVGPDGRFWGEDWTFCQNAMAAGFEIWVDPNITFTHRGAKKWTDRLSDHLDTFRAKGKVGAETARQGRGTHE